MCIDNIFLKKNMLNCSLLSKLTSTSSSSSSSDSSSDDSSTGAGFGAFFDFWAGAFPFKKK